MKSRPILFSSAMVRAIIAGRKSQTRRIFWQAAGPSLDIDVDAQLGVAVLSWLHGPGPGHEVQERTARHACPYGAPGDQLWVREEHYRYGHWEKVTGQQRRTRTGRQRWRFVADTSEVLFDAPPGIRLGRHHRDPATRAWHKRLARFMPRAFSRITLEIVEVRVQRLQEISEDDARAEGCSGTDPEPAAEGGTIYAWHGRSSAPCPRAHFATLWDSINGKRCPWSSSPWCWCLTFRRLA